MSSMILAPTLPDTIELLTTMKPKSGRKELSFPERLQNVQLLCRDGNRKLLAALGTAPLEDYLTVFGLHALAETMRTLSPDSARLICAFAHNTDSLNFIRSGFFSFRQRVSLTIFTPSCQDETDNRGSLSQQTRGKQGPENSCKWIGALLVSSVNQPTRIECQKRQNTPFWMRKNHYPQLLTNLWI
jgi:hypothetical protein